MRCAIAAAAALLALAASSASATIIIDDFEAGAFSITGDPLIEFDQLGLPTANVIGGWRRTALCCGESRAELVLTPGDDALSASLATLDLSYVPGVNLDLTQGGTLDRIEIEFVGSATGVTYFADGAVQTDMQVIGSRAVLLLSDLAQFPVIGTQLDPLHTTSLRFQISAFNPVAIASIRVLPEPSLIALLSAAFLSCTFLRRTLH